MGRFEVDSMASRHGYREFGVDLKSKSDILLF